MTLHKLFISSLIVTSILLLFSMLLLAQASEVVNTFIIHVEKPDADIEDLTTFHLSFLPITTNKGALLYSYKHTHSGFSARLTGAELQTMEKKEGFISATQERTYQLSTTRSPSFLGLHPGMGLWNQSNKGKGVSIGVLDTGIFPSHPSFSDTNMPSPPAKWKGKCEFPIITQCNNKIIAAQSFNRGANVSGPVTPIDENGHGTHTSSTAAGGFVWDACVLGSACGTSAGMAPQAHLAIYKVCIPNGECNESDILAGIDAAIEDGVDVLSMSLGAADSTPFYNDNVLIGVFAAVQKGIFVSFSAGNYGPYEQTVGNEAPWIMTAGASTIDRSIRATAKLGNGKVFDGQSIIQLKNFSAKLLPLVYAGSNGIQDSAFCTKGSLAGLDIKGKIILCDGTLKTHPFTQSQVVKDAGGAAVILANQEIHGFFTTAGYHAIPATEVSYVDAQIIKAYVNSTKSPTATILFKGTIIGDPLAPTVAYFSGRGPSLQTPGILKPDIIGPGVDILAAVPYSIDGTKSKLTFDMYSGTSMACPHVSGVAALIKSAHPNWSAAAIKSAIMTTADLVNVGKTPILDQKHTPADVFATGAGHLNPFKAANPGLVYDMQQDDYIPYLCGLGYTEKQVSKIVGKSVDCSSQILQGQLNYPTFSISLGRSQTFSRTVTNVGEPSSYYFVRISAPQGVEIVVKPRELRFSCVNRKAIYYVTFTQSNNKTMTNKFAQGHLEWVSGKKYSVRSVISVTFAGHV